MDECIKNFYSANRILVLAPHPDDETLGCGGTIAKLARSGRNVCVLVISMGGAVNVKIKGLVDIRKNEAYKACEILGVKELFFRDFPDGGLDKHYDEVKESIRSVIKSYNPDIIFSPSVMDLHPDHVTTSKITLSLLKEFNSFKVAFYEVYTPIRFNCIIDITDMIEIKEKAAICYKYSLLEKPENMFHAIKGLNAYRSFDFLNSGFFEVFYIINATDSEDEIIDWLTHGLSKEASSYRFLSEFKKADQLLVEHQEALVEINELKELLKEKEKKIENIGEKYKALEDSEILKIVYYIYKMRDAVLPHNTKRRLLYNAIVEKIKSKMRR